MDDVAAASAAAWTIGERLQHRMAEGGLSSLTPGFQGGQQVIYESPKH